MRKDHTYKLLLLLELESSEIVAAECGCPAGKGPRASCKHIGAMCYALEEFTRFGHLLRARISYSFGTGPGLEIIPVATLTSRRIEMLKKVSKSTPVSTFDPHQPDRHKLGSETMEKLHCNLLVLNHQPCAFLDILVPSVDKIRHDHTYTMPQRDDVRNVNAEATDDTEQSVHTTLWANTNLM